MSEKNASVSILMPAYNCERFIKEAIDSVLAQSYTDFELLIINDGSTDNTDEIIKCYSDKRIKYHYHSNRGVARSLNIGLDLANGEYIRRHDADDISEPWMLEKEFDFLKRHPEISFVSTQCAFMTENSKIAYKYRQPKQSQFENQSYFIAQLNHFSPASPIVHGTVLGPTKIFKEYGGYRTEFLTSEDNDLWLRIIEKYNFAVLNCCPYYLRLSGNSATIMHKPTIPFYRQAALSFAQDRHKTGTDHIMRGEKIPEPPTTNIDTREKTDHILAKKGKLYRADILDFKYQIFVNAKDFPLIWQSIKVALSNGWKMKQTWRALFLPLLGDNLVKLGVKIKGLNRR